MLVGRARAQVILRLVLAFWWVGWVLTKQAAGLWWSWGRYLLLMGRAGTQGLWLQRSGGSQV